MNILARLRRLRGRRRVRLTQDEVDVMFWWLVVMDAIATARDNMLRDRGE